MSQVNSLLDIGIMDACCACGGGNSVGGTCVNKAGFNATCVDEVENDRICANGSPRQTVKLLLRKDSRGRPMREACCVSGGGTTYKDASEFKDQLLGWELRVYGHEQRLPTAAPVTVPPPTTASQPTTVGQPTPVTQPTPVSPPTTATQPTPVSPPTAVSQPTTASQPTLVSSQPTTVSPLSTPAPGEVELSKAAPHVSSPYVLCLCLGFVTLILY